LLFLLFPPCLPCLSSPCLSFLTSFPCPILCLPCFSFYVLLAFLVFPFVSYFLPLPFLAFLAFLFISSLPFLPPQRCRC
jgi:hypothetical protein